MQSVYAEYFLRTPLHEPYTPNELRLKRLVLNDQMLRAINAELASPLSSENLRSLFEGYTASRFPLQRVDPGDFFAYAVGKGRVAPPRSGVPVRTEQQELAWRKDPRGKQSLPMPEVTDRNSDRVLTMERF